MAKWSQNEVELLMSYAIASDDETMQELYEYVHYMMYQSGEHEYPYRTLSAVTAKIRQTAKQLRRKEV